VKSSVSTPGETARSTCGDPVMAKRPSAVATLVERSALYVRIVPLPHGCKDDAVRRAIVDDLVQLPLSMRGSLS
jgi:hypothetical protein